MANKEKVLADLAAALYELMGEGAEEAFWRHSLKYVTIERGTMTRLGKVDPVWGYAMYDKRALTISAGDDLAELDDTTLARVSSGDVIVLTARTIHGTRSGAVIAAFHDAISARCAGHRQRVRRSIVDAVTRLGGPMREREACLDDALSYIDDFGLCRDELMEQGIMHMPDVDVMRVVRDYAYSF